ncbi:MAG: TetR family transcriptional regulator [Lachnospiraceae bacterium]|nr:TetR family transcriptional regulator [Lachnospiraceae bacterium]
MNQKFYALPEEKRQVIINAGFRVFSRNTYKKSPMQEIADCAGISKSLLFHYFQNKRELYLFLWNQAAELTMESLLRYGCYESSDFFEMIERGMQAKLNVMRVYPDMAAFAVKAFYEEAAEVSAEIQKSYQRHFGLKAQNILSRLNPEDFVPGLDLALMCREMYLVSEGYLWEMLRQRNTLDTEALERDFSNLLQFWKHIYLARKE